MKTILFKVTIAGPGTSRSIDIDTPSCVLGRSKDCEIMIDDDLISRKHLKIYLENDSLFIEELGSSNGSWFNGARLQKNVKTPYKKTDEVQLGKILSGISLVIEREVAKNVLAKPTLAVMNSDQEKTLVMQIAPKVLNEIDTPTMLVANGAPISYSVNKPVIKLVETDIIPPKPVSAPTQTTEQKSGLENKVKLLINQESEKLREVALKQSNEILHKAKAEERDMLLKAQKEAQDIVHQARLEADKQKLEANEAIVNLQDKVRSTKIETDDMVRNYKNTALKIEATVKNLKKEEEQFQQKIKYLEDNVVSIQEKIRNENILLEDIKNQASLVRRNADIKFEELVMEERRARARIETEIIEAKTQTAKVYAEAEKIQAQKEAMEAEISQLRSDKGHVEREINDLQISCRRHEYEFEKLNREYDLLQVEKNNALATFENLSAEGKILADNFLETKRDFEEKEAELQVKLTELTESAEQIIPDANVEAAKIIAAAKDKATQMAEKSQLELKEHEAQKVALMLALDADKKTKLQEIHDEAEKHKAQAALEIKRAEQKKESIISETKWLEENAQKKCEKIIIDGKAEAEALKLVLKKEHEHLKATTQLDFQTQKAQLLKENELLKSKAASEAQALKEKVNQEIFQLKQQADFEIAAKKEEAHAYAEKIKLKADKMLGEEQTKWDNKYAKLDAEIQSNIEAKKRHEAALVKTEALKDENFVQANFKIQAMLAEAQQRVEATERECSIIKSKEQSILLDMRKLELEKIEDLKAKFEQYKVDTKNDIAEHAALAVEEFLVSDMIKSRNLQLNEKLIKRFGERAKTLTINATLGRIHPSEKGVKHYPTTDYRKLIKWSARFAILTAIVYGVFWVMHTYPAEIKMVINYVRVFIKENDIRMPEMPSKDQIIDFLR